ncbi:MAG: hypothetical protein JRE45_13950 [Deltaproteobacteria bacterium]|nr:hypothetical protein [Deltaproteobacteria bacterium]
MRSSFAVFVGFWLAMFVAQSALAADTCTIMYRVDATFDGRVFQVLSSSSSRKVGKARSPMER